MGIISKIIRESYKILIIASIISTIGGVGLEALQQKVVAFLPLLILLPALNSMIGSFGTLVSSKFTTFLFLGKIQKKAWQSKELNSLLKNILSIALIVSIYLGVLTSFISYLRGFAIDLLTMLKIILISLILTSTLVIIIISVGVIGGLIVYKRNADPNNYLIPLTTSMADFGSLLLLTGILYFFF